MPDDLASSDQYIKNQESAEKYISRFRKKTTDKKTPYQIKRSYTFEHKVRSVIFTYINEQIRFLHRRLEQRHLLHCLFGYLNLCLGYA